MVSYADGILPPLQKPKLTRRVVKTSPDDEDTMSVQSEVTNASFGIPSDHWSYSQHGTPISSRPSSRPLTPEHRSPSVFNIEDILKQNRELNERLAQVEAIAVVAQAQLPYVNSLSKRKPASEALVKKNNDV